MTMDSGSSIRVTYSGKPEEKIVVVLPVGITNIAKIWPKMSVPKREWHDLILSYRDIFGRIRFEGLRQTEEDLTVNMSRRDCRTFWEWVNNTTASEQRTIREESEARAKKRREEENLIWANKVAIAAAKNVSENKYSTLLVNGTGKYTFTSTVTGGDNHRYEYREVE